MKVSSVFFKSGTSRLSFYFLFGLVSLTLVSACSVVSEESPVPDVEEILASADANPPAPAASSAPTATPSDDYTPPSTFVDARLQVGPWFPAPFNVEEPYINIIQASAVYWANDTLTAQEVYEGGHVDPDTGLLTSFPAGETSIYSSVFFSGADKSFYDGEWVLEWDGDADLRMQFISADLQRQVGPNRIEFTRDIAVTPDHARILVTRLGPGGLTGLRLFRAENEAALDAGRIFAPGFVENVGRAHVVRTMDLQEANRAYIRRVEQVAPLTQHFWGNFDFFVGNVSYASHKSMPLEAVAALALEADVEVWHHAPSTLGFPIDFADPSVHDDDLGIWSENIKSITIANINTILSSPEWDRYADAFVAALAARGYPEDRTLYTTVSNEVWNFALQYHITTRYAASVWEAYEGTPWAPRYGYGVMMGRWMLALEGAFARAGRNQNVVYVVEGQAANQNSTRQALVGMQTYLTDEGEVWTDFNSKIGVSVASYWGGQGYYSFFEDMSGATLEELHTRFANEVGSDPVGLARRFADFYIDGPEDVISTKAWVLDRFSQHDSVSNEFGVSLIGAYEGGSHDLAPDFFRDTYGASSELLFEWYEDYMWGVEGARINNDINDALATAHPGIILSNYVTYGPTGGQPWFDGQPGEDTPMQISWSKYYRP